MSARLASLPLFLGLVVLALGSAHAQECDCRCGDDPEKVRHWGRERLPANCIGGNIADSPDVI